MRISAIYLFTQGLAGTAWWLALAFHPPFRSYFKPPESPDWTILSFGLADLSLFVVGSLLSGVLIARRSEWSRPTLLFTAGAVSYAALYCLGLSLLTNSTWLGTATMLPAMLATLVIAIREQQACSS